MFDKPIPYGKQNIDSTDIQAVVEVLHSDYLTQGPKILEFERAFSEYIGCKYAVAVSNGTAALHLCTLALNVGKGDKVITTPITFAASANCVKYCGGEIVFADINPETYLIDINQVRNLLQASLKGEYTGMILVDFAGSAIDLEKFKELANEYNLWIIEDACHSPGGYFIDSKGQQQNCGNGQYADLAIFSFHPVKHIACGEGGMITTNSEEQYHKLLKLRTHGIVKSNEAFVNTVELAGGDINYPGWYMEMQELGYNYRLTDFQAALGLSQLSKADQGINRRKEIASIYSKAFKNKSYILGCSGNVIGHAYHLYLIEVNDRLGLYNYLRTQNIYTQIHYIPCHLMPYYRNLGWDVGDFPLSENYYKHCISLPMFPTLTNTEQDYIIDCISEYYK
jgi:UDP-4-amino-4,6-dideoxy-N-acetyl-beta-L-altrosamine transaminase